MKSIRRFILFILLFLSILFIKNNSYASFDFNIDSNYYSLPDLPFDTTEHPDFIIIYNNNSSRHQVAYPAVDYQTPFYYYTDENQNRNGFQYWAKDDTEKTFIGLTNDNDLKWNYYNLEAQASTWNEMSTSSGNQIKTSNDDGIYGDLLYSSVDILNVDNSIYYSFEDRSIINENIFEDTTEDTYNIETICQLADKAIVDNSIDKDTYKYITCWFNPNYSALFVYYTPVPLYFDDSGRIFSISSFTGYYKGEMYIDLSTNTYYDISISSRLSTTISANTNIPDSSGCTLIMANYDVTSADGNTIYLQNNYVQSTEDDEEYIFPYIADTDDVLSNLDAVDDILVFPRRYNKKSITYGLFYL